MEKHREMVVVRVPSSSPGTRRRFSEEVKHKIVGEQQTGYLSTNEVCQKYQLSPATFYHWKKELRMTESKESEAELDIKAVLKEQDELKRKYAEFERALARSALEVHTLKEEKAIFQVATTILQKKCNRKSNACADGAHPYLSISRKNA